MKMAQKMEYNNWTITMRFLIEAFSSSYENIKYYILREHINWRLYYRKLINMYEYIK